MRIQESADERAMLDLRPVAGSYASCAAMLKHHLTESPACLDGWQFSVPETPSLAIEVCARHLARLGAAQAPRPRVNEEERVGDESLFLATTSDTRRSAGNGYVDPGSITATTSWPCVPGPAEFSLVSEPLVQAMCGLMAVHGRDHGTPRRLGLEAVSVACGILAAQGVLAALIGRNRGRRFGGVQTSALGAGLQLMTHYIAAATAEDPEWRTPEPADGPGPPFPTADGEWFEIETLDPESWVVFWRELGVGGPEISRGWGLFVQRYETATCSLPARLHEATARHDLAALDAVAARSGVSLCRLRGYSDVIGDEECMMAAMRPWRIELAPGVLAEARGAAASGRVDEVRAAAAAGEAPLAGLRVVEATRRLQGPLAGQLLRMLGAEVMRLEPLGGDLTRGMPPVDGDLGAIFLALNRHKRSVEIDPKLPSGRSALLELLADADVFMHNWRPGRAEELALGPGDLARSNPRLIYAHASGWGRASGPSRLLGTDYLVQAFTAAGEGLNPTDEPAHPSRLALVDLMGALVACEGILAALYARERNGGGPSVETSLLSGAMALQEHVLNRAGGPQETSRRRGRPFWGVLDRPLPTAEGSLALDVRGRDVMRRLCEACQLEAGEGCEARVAQRLVTRPAREWEALLRERGVGCAVVAEDLSRLPADPALSGLLEVSGPSTKAPAPPWRFSRQPA